MRKWLILLSVFILSACAGDTSARKEFIEFAMVAGQKDREMDERVARLEEIPVESVDPKTIEELAAKIEALEKKIATAKIRAVEMNPIYFPLGKTRVEDLPKEEFGKLQENAERIREEKPSKLVISAWSEKHNVSTERANSIRDYYINKTQGVVNPEIVAVSQTTVSEGRMGRRVLSVMWVAGE